MTPPLRLRFVMSADDLARLPDARAEVAFVGRSNVGKSSLLNAVGGSAKLAHVSKTPGRTRLLNCFSVAGDESATVVDCPGYGYAAAPAKVTASWQRMMERYLLERPQLAMVLVLVDGEVGPTKLDLQMLDWLRAGTVPHTVVATKQDKVKSSRRDARRTELAAACSLAADDVVWVSAAKGTGIDRLRALIATWLELA